MSAQLPMAGSLYGACLRSSLPLAGLSTSPDSWTELELDWRADPTTGAIDRFWSPLQRPAWVASLQPARVALAANADPDGLNQLASSVLPAWLAHAGALVLRGSAVRTGQGAWLVLGTGMIGKSTLAAALLRHGAVLISDDVVVLRRDAGGRVLAYPGAPWLKLWPAYAKAFCGLRAAVAAPRVAGKCRLPLPLAIEAVPVVGCGLLVVDGSAASVRPLAGPTALDALGNLQRRAVPAPAAPAIADQFRTLCALQRQAPLRLLARASAGPRGYLRLAECWLAGSRDQQPG